MYTHETICSPERRDVFQTRHFQPGTNSQHPELDRVGRLFHTSFPAQVIGFHVPPTAHLHHGEYNKLLHLRDFKEFVCY